VYQPSTVLILSSSKYKHIYSMSHRIHVADKASTRCGLLDDPQTLTLGTSTPYTRRQLPNAMQQRAQILNGIMYLFIYKCSLSISLHFNFYYYLLFLLFNSGQQGFADDGTTKPNNRAACACAFSFFDESPLVHRVLPIECVVLNILLEHRL